MKFWTVFRPATGALAMLVLFLAVGATAETTNTLSDAEIQGRQLAQQLCDAKPVENFKNNGTLKIRDANDNRIEIPFSGETFVTPTNWEFFYKATCQSNRTQLMVIHVSGRPNDYFFWEHLSDLGGKAKALSGSNSMTPFADSDFWLCDLGLEFFHWPEQKILPKTTNLKRGRDYTLLESTNPNPGTNGYSRVRSWIDKETGGILEAEAYDAQGKLLKEFEPKSFKKVNGQWELQDMEINNVQTGSRTRLEFDLKK